MTARKKESEDRLEWPVIVDAAYHSKQKQTKKTGCTTYIYI